MKGGNLVLYRGVMSRNTGIDVGFGFTKLTGDGEEHIFPSIIGEARPIRFESGLKTSKALENLVLELEGERYFLGELANQQSNFLLSTLSKERLVSKESKILFLAALGILLKEEMGIMNLVTGLPVDEYVEYKESLQQLMKGPHSFKINEESKIIKIERIRVIPQPFGAIFHHLLNEKGEIENEEYGKMNLGIIDIGFRTSDFCVSNQLEFIDRLSSTSTIALKNAHDFVGLGLNERYGINRSPYQLDSIMRKQSIIYNGREEDISELVETAYRITADKIVSEINSRWTDKWEMNQILISGGGGETLFDYIQERVKNCRLAENSQFSNVKGYLKIAMRSWPNEG